MSRIDIQIEPAEWGSAQLDNILAVLRSAAKQFVDGSAHTAWPGVYVSRSNDSPIILDARRPDGRVVIKLNTQDTYWCQYAYQFAHEWVHLMAGHLFPANIRWRGTQNFVGWFEESLCETGSLFALNALSVEWRENPPYPNWRDFAPSFSGYAQGRMDAEAHSIGDNETFRDWLAAHMAALRNDSCKRDLNTIVAKHMLPVFERNPRMWDAVAYLRASRAGPDVQLAEHLDGWQAACPEEMRHHVDALKPVFAG